MAQLIRVTRPDDGKGPAVKTLHFRGIHELKRGGAVEIAIDPVEDEGRLRDLREQGYTVETIDQKSESADPAKSDFLKGKKGKGPATPSPTDKNAGDGQPGANPGQSGGNPEAQNTTGGASGEAGKE